MANPHRIGIYLTNQNIVLAESDSNKLNKIASSSLSSGPKSQDIPLHSDVTDEILIVGSIQKLLRESKVDPGNISISIPIDEVFLRSFVIPWMPASELNNVVYYEAKKYVPFDLKLLEYVYHGVTFTENNQKRLRIIFYAIRKQTLERYDRIFKQTNCKPVSYEPSVVSLAKQLVATKHLRTDQRIVAIYVRENYGQIIFYERGISYFVREFSVALTEVIHDSKAVPDVLRAQLLREIRKSMGYYNRQFSQEKIKEVLLLTSAPDQELIKELTEEFSVKVRSVEPMAAVGLQKIVGMDALCAAGACVVKTTSELSSFNFLQSRIPIQASNTSSFLPLGLVQFFVWDRNDFIYAIWALIASVLLLGAGVFYTQNSLKNIQTQSNQLTLKQGDLNNKSIDEINELIKQNKEKIISHDKVLNDRSEMSLMLIHLTNALPEGVWIDRISMSRQSIEFQGHVFSPAEGMHFKIINGLIANLKNDKFLSSIKFKLKVIQKKLFDNHEVYFFSISGS